MKIKFSFVFFAVFFLLCLSSISALGLTPARASIDFTPDLKKTISLTIVNSEKKDLNLVVAVQGDLKDYVYVQQPNFFMSAGQASRDVSYTLSLPHQMPPGPHTAEIVVLQLPEKGTFEATYVGAALAVANELVVNVPYPGKFVESKLSVLGPDSDGNYNFVLPMVNRGSFDIVDAGASIDLRCPLDGGVVATLNTERVSLPSRERMDVSSKWSPNVRSGECKAIATVSYDDEKPQNFENVFTVGGEALTLVSMKVNDFSLGDIAKFDAVVRNNLPQSAKSAKLDLEIYDDSGNVLANPVSATQDIDSQQKTTMQLFWDTKGVRAGDYNAKLLLKSEDKEDSVDFQMVVSENDISFVGLGYVIAKPTRSSSGGNSLTVVLIILVALLILVNVSWFFFLRKKLTK